MSEIEPPIATLSVIEQEYVKGLTKDMVVDALMGDKQIVVQEEIPKQPVNRICGTQ